MKKVDYDQVAATHDGRYRDGGPADLAAFVRRRSAEAGDRPVLEVGCGTGRWLAEAIAAGHRAVGLDPSPAMLARARQRAPAARIVRGRAESLPFARSRFGAVLCIYVIHHLDDPARFVMEAAALLAPGGALAVAALAPHHGRDDWYVYDYFEGTREADCARYPTTAAAEAWMKLAGLADVRIEVAAHIAHQAVGTAVFDDPILSRHGTCQLSLLDDEAFERGMARLRADATRPDAPSFATDLRIFATTGRKV